MKTKKSILSVIPLALLFALIVGAVTYFTSDKLGLSNYKAQSKILTSNKASISEEDNLALAFAATIDSDAIKKKVLENLELDWTPAQLDKELTIVPIKSSPVINIIVEDPIKLRAEDLADEYADISVKLINDLYKGSTQVLEYSYNNSGLKSQKEKFALIFTIAAFIIWFLFGSFFTALENRKIEKENQNLFKKNLKKDEQEKIQQVEEVEKTNTNKYRVLGNLPEYDEDDLDV